MKGYKILIVDDEELAIRGIEKGVRWERLGIEQVFKAHSMMTAVRIMESYSVDIVLTDIEMPEGSGLDLIRWIKEKQPGVFCIFYTCHAEFRYAQEAVRLGVRAYLLKPVPYVDLEEILRNCIRQREEQAKRDELADIWEDVYTPKEGEPIRIVKDYIMKNIYSNIQRDELAMLVHMSPDYLSRIFKKSEGISLSEFIADKKHSIAKQFLKNTDLSVSDIGKKIGYMYPSYFVKAFSKMEGMTPQQYRKNIL